MYWLDFTFPTNGLSQMTYIDSDAQSATLCLAVIESERDLITFKYGIMIAIRMGYSQHNENFRFFTNIIVKSILEIFPQIYQWNPKTLRARR